MNNKLQAYADKLQAFARQSLKDGLAQCSPAQQHRFKLMYAPGAYEGRAELDTPINEVVDKMPVEKLDWAMQQVDRTVAELGTVPC